MEEQGDRYVNNLLSFNVLEMSEKWPTMEGKDPWRILLKST